MAWVRLDEDFAQHPKVLRAGPLAMAMQVAALCYCNRNLTDGFIPRGAARTLLDWQVVDKNGAIHDLAYTSGAVGNDVTSDWVIELLVDAKLWDELPNGYQIHDYLDYQPSKSSVTKQRAGTKARVRKWRENKQEIKKQEGNAVTNSDETPAPDTDTDSVEGKKDPSGPKKEGSASKEKPKVGLNDLTVKMFEEFAKEKTPSVNILLELERFHDHWRSKGKRFKDNSAAFRNWLRKAQEFHDERVGSAGGNGAAKQLTPDEDLAHKAWFVKRLIRTTTTAIGIAELRAMVAKGVITQDEADLW